MNDLFKRNVLTRIRYKLAHNEQLDKVLAFMFILLIGGYNVQQVIERWLDTLKYYI